MVRFSHCCYNCSIRYTPNTPSGSKTEFVATDIERKTTLTTKLGYHKETAYLTINKYYMTLNELIKQPENVNWIVLRVRVDV